MKFFRYIFLLAFITNSPADDVFSKLKNLLTGTPKPHPAQYYLLESKSDDKPIIVLEISEAVVKEINNFAANKATKNIINDSNFDIIHQQQNMILSILDNFKIDGEKEFKNSATNIKVIIDIIDLATNLFPLNDWPTENYKELKSKFITLLNDINQLNQEYEICCKILVLCGFLFRNADDSLIFFIKNLDHSEILKEQQFKNILKNYFDLIKYLLPINNETYEEIIRDIENKARSKSNLFPTHFLFIIFTAIKDYLNLKLKSLNNYKIQFNSTINSYKPKIEELSVSEDLQKEKRELLIKFLSYLNRKVESQLADAKQINSLVEAKSSIMTEIIRTLSEFSNYNSDEKILRKIEQTNNENLNNSNIIN